ncbi:MAG: TRAM domain-containing protein, partial [Candidatus Melainabacteria bacterium]|nr:TRAM domain-containing protein [Candidatus Melainabacteria bacterium]
GPDELIGKVVNVKITKMKPWALFGEIVNQEGIAYCISPA